MIKLLALLLFIASPVYAKDPKVESFSNEALGCMILKECNEEVSKITKISDIKDYHPKSDYSSIAPEVTELIKALQDVGVDIYIGPERYFPATYRGIYKTDLNSLFLNEVFISRPEGLITVLRHEGWHAAQDCMAGSINNSLIAVILPESSIPRVFQVIVEKTYEHVPSAIPWEKGAYWAGREEGMTLNALKACSSGEMWKHYDPTPLTKKYLLKEGYLTMN